LTNKPPPFILNRKRNPMSANYKPILSAAIILGFVVSPVSAQDPAGPSQPPPQAAEQRIRAALARPITVDYKDASLNKVVDDLRNKLHVPIRLDRRALDELSIDPSTTTVTFSVSDISAKSALNLMLHQVGLTWTIYSEVLLITSAAELENPEFMVRRIYDVADLVTVENVPEECDYDSLIDLITNTIRPNSWTDLGGPGVIREYPTQGIKALVVTQTLQVQDEVAELLAGLRALRDARQKNSAGPRETNQITPPAPTRGISPAEEKIRQLLHQPIEVHFKATPLTDAAAWLQKQEGFTVKVDAKALAELNVDPSVPVTLDLKTLEMQNALEQMLREHELTWTVKNDCLIITTPAAAETDDYLSTRVYDVSDLIAFHDARGAPITDPDKLVELITNTVLPQSWEEIGGPGKIRSSAKNGLQVLVIYQTWRTHEMIEDLLANLRRLRDGMTADKR
jgi:hypothetical protein